MKGCMAAKGFVIQTQPTIQHQPAVSQRILTQPACMPPTPLPSVVYISSNQIASRPVTSASPMILSQMSLPPPTPMQTIVSHPQTTTVSLLPISTVRGPGANPMQPLCISVSEVPVSAPQQSVLPVHKNMKIRRQRRRMAAVIVTPSSSNQNQDGGAVKMAEADVVAMETMVTDDLPSIDYAPVVKMAAQEKPTTSSVSSNRPTYAASKLGVSGLHNLVVGATGVGSGPPPPDKSSAQFTTRVFITQSATVNATMSHGASIMCADHGTESTESNVADTVSAPAVTESSISTANDLLQQKMVSVELPPPSPPSGDHENHIANEPTTSPTASQLAELGVNMDMLSKMGDTSAKVVVTANSATEVDESVVVTNGGDTGIDMVHCDNVDLQEDAQGVCMDADDGLNDGQDDNINDDVNDETDDAPIAVSAPTEVENTMPSIQVTENKTVEVSNSDEMSVGANTEVEMVMSQVSEIDEAKSNDKLSDVVDSTESMAAQGRISPEGVVAEVACQNSSPQSPSWLTSCEAQLKSSVAEKVPSPSHNVVEADVATNDSVTRGDDPLSHDAVEPCKTVESSSQNAVGVTDKPPYVVESCSMDDDDCGHSSDDTDDDTSSCCGQSIVDSSLDEQLPLDGDSSDCGEPSLASAPARQTTALPPSDMISNINISPVVKKPLVEILPKPIDSATIHRMPSSPRTKKKGKPRPPSIKTSSIKPRRLIPNSMFTSPAKEAAKRWARNRLRRHLVTKARPTARRILPLPPPEPLLGDSDEESCDSEEDDDEDEDVEEAQVVEDDFAELFAASSTINFAQPKKLDESDPNYPKLKGKKAILLDLLVPNLIESDPLCDERDTAFARTYLNKVKACVKREYADIYMAFVKLLYNYPRNESTPIDLYDRLCKLLAHWPELLRDFAGFLKPAQAEACGCFMENYEFLKARTFLRKLEVHFRTQPALLQRVLRVFTDWQNSGQDRNLATLKTGIQPIIQSQPHLLQEFAWFFSDEPVPRSYLTEFEEAVLPDNEDDLMNLDNVEEAQLPTGDDECLGTHWCKCQCHISHGGDSAFQRRRLHCSMCVFTGVKTHRGKVYMQTADSQLKPVSIVFPAPPGDQQEHRPDDDNDEGGSDDVKATLEEKPEICTNLPETTETISTNGPMPDDDHPNLTPPNALLEDNAKASSPHVITPVESGVIAESDTLCDGGRNEDDLRDQGSMEEGKMGVEVIGIEDVVWTRDEDQHLLEACKQHGPMETTFQMVATQLGNQTTEMVMQRFQHLMRLFSDEPSDTDKDSDDDTLESD